MKNLVFTLFCSFLINVGLAQNIKEVFGTISDDFGFLENVIVSVNDQDTRTVSDVKGNYRIAVEEGDVLRFEHLGKLPLEIKVEDVTRILNMTMFDDAEMLDEVTVNNKRLKTQDERAMEYATNPNIIKNAYGYLDKETAGYSMRILEEKDFGPHYTDIGTLMNGKFAGVMAHCNIYTGEVEVSVRVNNTSYGNNTAIYDVDGVIMYSLPCSLIDPSNIKKIAVIRGQGGSGLYGSNVMGGVVVINTKTGTFASVQKENLQRAKERNQKSIYTGDAIPIDAQQGLPTYLERYHQSLSETEALNIYANERDKYAASFYFVLDSYAYFKEKWNNDEFADSIIKKNYGLFEKNPIALKSLAYMYQAHMEYEKAKDIYKEVFILRTEYAQSYYDLAESHIENKEYARAATIFTRYDYLKEQGFLNDEKGDFTQFMNVELNNLLGLKENDFLSLKEQSKLVSHESFKGTRIVFEWAESEAEFELQMVNPENRFFIWNHSLKDNCEQIKDEKSIGYATKEYLIGNTYRGDWQVNIKYFGNKSLTPTYLKVAIYHDYGTFSQRKETKVFKLALKNVNQQLFTVSNISGLVSN